MEQSRRELLVTGTMVAAAAAVSTSQQAQAQGQTINPAANRPPAIRCALSRWDRGTGTQDHQHARFGRGSAENHPRRWIWLYPQRGWIGVDAAREPRGL